MALNAESNSLEILLQGSTLCVQKFKNGEESVVIIPHKNIANTVSEKFVIRKILMYVFGYTSQDIAINISDEAKDYILSCVA